MEQPQLRRRLRMPKLWTVLCIALIAVQVFPVRCHSLRFVMLALLVLVVLGAEWLWRKSKGLWLTCAAFALVVFGWMALPPQLVAPARLRSSYVRELNKFTGTLFVWGGETRLGVDCSGLIRAGMIRACLREGIRAANRPLLREAAYLWWNDCSAKELGNGCGGRTRRLFSAPSINQLDHKGLLPGDFAITTNGVHALAYLGRNLWIEADPLAFRVIKVRVPTNTETWFDMPVWVMRWNALDA